ncbi:hypothetical protein T484DRAFT_1784125, partial [Baffinella frigidus]
MAMLENEASASMLHMLIIALTRSYSNTAQVLESALWLWNNRRWTLASDARFLKRVLLDLLALPEEHPAKGVGTWTAVLVVVCFAIDRATLAYLDHGLSRSSWSQCTVVAADLFHNSPGELGENMLCLLAYGTAVETQFGPWMLLLVHVFCGVLNSIVWLWTSGFPSETFSGANYGLMTFMLAWWSLDLRTAVGRFRSLVVALVILQIIILEHSFNHGHMHLGGYMGGLLLAVFVYSTQRAAKPTEGASADAAVGPSGSSLGGWTVVLVVVNTLCFAIDSGTSTGHHILQFMYLQRSLGRTSCSFWTVVTANLCHDSREHLGCNMESLLAFGTAVETHFGPRRLLVVYFLCGTFNSIVWLWTAG